MYPLDILSINNILKIVGDLLKKNLYCYSFTFFIILFSNHLCFGPAGSAMFNRKAWMIQSKVDPRADDPALHSSRLRAPTLVVAAFQALPPGQSSGRKRSGAMKGKRPSIEVQSARQPDSSATALSQHLSVPKSPGLQRYLSGARIAAGMDESPAARVTPSKSSAKPKTPRPPMGR